MHDLLNSLTGIISFFAFVQTNQTEKHFISAVLNFDKLIF